MMKSYYKHGKTNTLDMLCDLLFQDTSKNCNCENEEKNINLIITEKKESSNNSIKYNTLDLQSSAHSAYIQSSYEYFNEKENFFNLNILKNLTHKQILSLVFKPIETTCLRNISREEILQYYKNAIKFSLKNKEKISIRYLCVYILLLNSNGMQLKKIYGFLLKIFPNISNEKNWKGRIRYSLSLYPQFEKCGQKTGSALWSFKLQ